MRTAPARGLGRRGLGRTPGVVVLGVCLALVGCGNPAPQSPAADPAPVVQALLDGLGRTDLTGVPATADAAGELREIVKSMDGVRPVVHASDVATRGDQTTIGLDYSWPFAGAGWNYHSTATLDRRDGQWLLHWDPTLVHPKLRFDNRLVHTNLPARRGRIMAAQDQVLAEERAVVRIGIDKSRVSPDQQDAAARRLASQFDVDPEKFAATVRSAGAQQFVEAISLRHDAPQAEGWRQIPGAISLVENRSLALEKELAPEIIGMVGPADEQTAAGSGNTLFPGDQSGTSGLQKRHDAVLRGLPGTRVTIVPRQSATGPTPGPQPSGTPGSTPQATAGPTPGPPRPELVFETSATAGSDVVTSLDVGRQRRAEQVLAAVPGAASLVAIRPSTGEILAAANSGAITGTPEATFGRHPPGSTFKIVTALALMRNGLSPDSTLDCGEHATVEGRTFSNYSEFPASKVGRLPLAQAVAYSCNTALINEHARIGAPALREAAASLGMGVDRDAGFPSFFGAVPDPANEVAKAESLIGQGQVEASPMAMAAVAASVQAGHTVFPGLLASHPAAEPEHPLAPGEAAALRQLMHQVVTEGTASSLNGVADGAKTGTAEFGTQQPPATHAWMIATRGDLAVAVWVNEGRSGSQTAGPLIRDFLR